MQRIQTSRKDRIAVLRICSPETHNGYDEALRDEFLSRLRELEEAPDVQLVVLTGSGELFCTGSSMDLLSHLMTLSADARLQSMERVQDIVRSVFAFPKQIVALVNGLAAGAGCELALACDRLYFTSAGRFNFYYSRLALVPDHGGLWLLERIVGSRKAAQLVLDSDVLSPQMAVSVGIADAVVEPESEAWHRTLRGLARIPVDVVRSVKAQQRPSGSEAFERALEQGRREVARLLDGAAQRDRIERTASMQRFVATAG